MKQLLGNLWIISGYDHTHPWDASSYFIPGDEPTFIDVGSSLGYGALKESLAELGYSPRDIRRVIGTHGHWDHLSGMASLREESDAELWLHEGDRAQVESGDYELTSAFVYGVPFPPVRVDRALRGGEVIRAGEYDLTIHHTPGHTPGSVSITTEIEGLKLLIAGDTVWGGYHPRIRSDMDSWHRSLDELRQLEFDVMTFGHWSGLIADAKPKVEKAVSGFGGYYDPWFTLEGRGY